MPQIVMQPLRVLLIDDHALVLAGLRMLIQSWAGLKVVGEASNRADALALATKEQPNIILLDLDLGRDNGLEFLPDLLSAAKEARIIVLTGVRDIEAHRRAISLGAMGVVPKEKAAEVLIKAFEKVHAGEVWLDRSMMASVLAEMSKAKETKKISPEAAKIATLTAREREVITLLGEGLKNKQIAERLFISDTTVRHHFTSIFSKLNVTDRFELLIYAYRHRLANPPR